MRRARISQLKKIVYALWLRRSQSVFRKITYANFKTRFISSYMNCSVYFKVKSSLNLHVLSGRYECLQKILTNLLLKDSKLKKNSDLKMNESEISG